MRRKNNEGGTMKKIGLIPLKCYSRRFQCKNFSTFDGKYLLENTLEKMLKADCLDEIYISTDCPEKVAKHMLSFDEKIKNANVFIVDRSERLHEITDVPTENIVWDFISNERYELDGEEDDRLIVLCQVTSPTWSPRKLSYAIHRHEMTGKTVVSVNPAYQPNGAFYIFKKSVFEAAMCSTESSASIYDINGVYAVILDWEESIDIDYRYQLSIAEAIARGDHDGMH